MGYVFRKIPLPDLPLRTPQKTEDRENSRLWTWLSADARPLRRIVFFVWGFDPYAETQLNNVQYFWNLINARDLATSITDLRNRELVVLMPHKTTLGVAVNGDYVAKIIGAYQSDATVASIEVVGFSMGGLIAKYALQSMVGRTEKIRSYFSYDTPHRGANVPLAVQYATDYLRDKGGQEQLNNINSQAAREALIYHYQDNWVDQKNPVRDPQRTALLNTYEKMAVSKRLLAHIPARYAIANGDAVERFAGGETLGGFSALGAEAGFNALKSDSQSITIWACGYRRWNAYADKAVAVDGMGGGTSDYMYTLLEAIYKGTTACVIHRPMDKPICFVPSASALDMQVVPDAGSQEDNSRIDFTGTCTMAGSTEHVSVHDQTKTFILDRLPE